MVKRKDRSSDFDICSCPGWARSLQTFPVVSSKFSCIRLHLHLNPCSSESLLRKVGRLEETESALDS